jgi:hypothetical protein
MDDIKEKLRQEYEEYRLPYTKYENGILWINDGLLSYYSWIEKRYIEAEKSAMCEANSNAVLADVRAMKRKEPNSEFYSEADIFDDGYNTAIDDIIQKISEHFS